MPSLERWQRIEEIFHDARQRGLEEREAYLRAACGGDSGLFREVSSLLDNHVQPDDDQFEPWAAVAAARLTAGKLSLEPGRYLGPYRIDCFLAAGGMGEVYRATDSRLNREVAIKISAAPFGERFEREARIIASLNHPNICGLYDVGPNYLVMELVEGITLADRLRTGALRVVEALGLARQIAEALEAAHDKGRIHCDLKPRNIQITPEGVVKLLDFGLAEAAGESSPGSDPEKSGARAIAGTPDYMSPEQKQGAPLDKRTDIWAFGAVFYEMLTGKLAFDRRGRAGVPDAVEAAPDWSALPPATPARIRKLLARCLDPDRKQRLRDIGEARIAIAAHEDAPAPSSKQRLSWFVAGAFALVLVLIVVTVNWRLRARGVPPEPPMRLTVETGPEAPLTSSGFQSAFAISPDGRRLVYAARGGDGVTRLALRPLRESSATTLAGTDNAQGPFFSPDGEWIGFFADDKLEKISVHGGAPIILCDAPGPRGASWGDDGNIIAALSLGHQGLSRIPAAGGTPVALESGVKEAIHRWPQALPGSRAVLFTAYRLSDDSEDAFIEVLSLDRGERKSLERGYFARYLPSGHVVFARGNTLFAAPFDLQHLALTAGPKPVLADVSGPAYTGARNFDFSQEGAFFYLSGTVGYNHVVSLVNGSGSVQPLRAEPGQYLQPRFSPDGKRLAFTLATGHGAEVWVQDLERGEAFRRSLLPGRNWWPLWTPDGSRIVFSSGNGGRHDLYSVPADGSGEAQRIGDENVQGIPRSFSPDGKRLAFDRENESGKEIWTAPLEGDPKHPRLGPPTRFADAATPVPAAQFSPDGQWMAYVSASLGITDVFVRPFPGPGGAWQISTGGGRFPVWSRNGRKLFFLGPDQRIRAVSYTAHGSSFSPGTPRVWSNLQVADLGVNASYDLAPDGEHVAAILSPELAGANSSPRLKVVIHFFDELRRQFQPSEK
jgi:Tol biopolymer transport system component